MLRAWRWGALALLVVGPASAQMSLIPQMINLEAVTCRDVLVLPGERRDRLLIYLNGYFDSTRRTSTWDERASGERIDRALEACKSRPEAPMLRVFADAWSR